MNIIKHIQTYNTIQNKSIKICKKQKQKKEENYTVTINYLSRQQQALEPAHKAVHHRFALCSPSHGPSRTCCSPRLFKPKSPQNATKIKGPTPRTFETHKSSPIKDTQKPTISPNGHPQFQSKIHFDSRPSQDQSRNHKTHF